MKPSKHNESREEQGVSTASLGLTLPVAHFVLARGGGVRTHCVSMRVNAGELLTLSADAKAHHRRLGEQLRYSYFSGITSHVPALNHEAWLRLANALDDIRALTLLVNTGKLPEVLRPILAETIEAITELRTTLLGANA